MAPISTRCPAPLSTARKTPGSVIDTPACLGAWHMKKAQKQGFELAIDGYVTDHAVQWIRQSGSGIGTRSLPSNRIVATACRSMTPRASSVA